MRSTRIAIVGGGLSGLYAAYRLTQQGVDDFVVIEAKPVPGGRILSLDIPGNTAPENRFDLGPTWFWPDAQPQLAQLVTDLELPSFAQYESGDMLIEQGGGSPIRRKGYPNIPASMRLMGGMNALTEALLGRIDPEKIHVGAMVSKISATEACVTLDVSSVKGGQITFDARTVLLAIPPRIATSRIEFDPPLPASLASAWQHTPTWMAPHAKYVAVYDTPFWRAQGLSGEARSARGPLAEIHDAGQPGGIGALFGFIGVPHGVRARLPDNALLESCRAQFVRLFGPQAANPVAHAIKDWSSDAFVATDDDLGSFGAHAAAPTAEPTSGPWVGRLTGIASEWSPQFPGYVAGAIEAADSGVRAQRDTVA